jgi:membrane protease YdiL (CAAX protease family)
LAICPHCGSGNAGDGAYCQDCGQPLKTAALPALPAPGASASAPLSTRDRVLVLLHLALLLAVLLGFSYIGAGGQHRVVERYGRPALYLATILWEWVLLAYVWVGMRRQRLTLAEITGGRWNTFEDALLDLAIAGGFWIAAAVVLGLVGYALGLAGPAQQADTLKKVGFLAPANAREIVIWLGLSATAGFCEEIIFRGYLQRQFIALTRSSVIGILLAAAVFGAAHGYEGVTRMVQIGVFGLMFGVLAHFRKSLRPGMIAHAWHDSFSGILLHVLDRVMKP